MTCFIGLIAVLPSEFFASTKEYQDFEIPDYFTASDIENIRHFENDTITVGVPYNDNWFDFNPEANFKFVLRWFHDATTHAIKPYHVTWQWWIFSNYEAMKFGDAQSLIYKETLVSHWDANVNASIFHPVRCDHITIKLWFLDTDENRNNIETAFDEGALTGAIGFGFSDYETTLNGWDVVGRLLTFQSPEIFGFEGGSATILNGILASGFYVCFALLVYILILKAIPFVGG